MNEEALRARLAGLPGVKRVLVSGPPWEVVLLYQAPEGGADKPIETLARALLVEAGLPAPSVQLEVGYLHTPAPRRRVRFVDAALSRDVRGRVSARVQLEWHTVVFEGRAEGEGGPEVSLRVAVQATLAALDRVLEGHLALHLVGAKTVRSFDTDMVVVLVADSRQGAHYTGVALVHDGDSVRAGCRAVLNATNRVLGNYLEVSG